MQEFAGVVYDKRKLRKAEGEDNVRQITTVVGMGRIIHLEDCVIEEWKIKEDLEGICSIRFKFHYATKRHNMLHNYSHYEVARSAEGNPILIRTWD